MIRNILLFNFLLLLLHHNLPAQTKTDGIMSLNAKERSIVSISAHTATGNMPGLKAILNNGLDAGLTISEAKEVIVQLYAYAGFPRSLNALHILMAALEERKQKGITDPAGKSPDPYPADKTLMQLGTENQTKLTGAKIGGGVYEFAPTIDRFLKEHLFGDIFGRNNLDWRTREIVTIAALAAMDGVEPQLRSHYNVGIYNGLTTDQLSQLVTIIETDISKNRGTIARQVLQSVINKIPYDASAIPGNAIFPTGQKIDNDNFVGNVWLQQLVQMDSSNKTQVGNVTFEPGARTKWHYHPAGQILLALDGLGYYQEKGSAKRMLRKGDVVKCPPNLPHWHGAAPGERFVQVAITNNEKGATVWLEAVSEEAYQQ
ncbi:carboxymuconolactone decarboxylase family protein [Flavihumibacter petaseus]|uniref:Carboxymuconolactone decarboxylase n=1 Tax=Flavihumibacter petaseus NBRC 106054 TaxID=1220578 RepID=A0A0E9MZ64_9BACT|nr:carboxymuconolactone decarboxylase family protein [Flavihumibacter petaseus]GAO43027.1 hypothetical protein FPE01S_02_01320 [Flavihumibacter petaseus NBRC 106054]